MRIEVRATAWARKARWTTRVFSLSARQLNGRAATWVRGLHDIVARERDHKGDVA
jgi:hypothetical protein